MVEGFFEQLDLLKSLLDSSLLGLEAYARQSPWRLPAEYRLAFRELGLSFGLRAVIKARTLIEGKPGLFKKLDTLFSSIEAFWRSTGECWPPALPRKVFCVFKKIKGFQLIKH
jgi:hypothetical protein